MSIELLCLVGDGDVSHLVATACAGDFSDTGWMWSPPHLEAGGRLIALLQAKALTPQTDVSPALRAAAPNATGVLSVVLATRDELEMSDVWLLVNDIVHHLGGAIYDGRDIRRGERTVREKRKPRPVTREFEYGQLLAAAKGPAKEYRADGLYAVGDVIDHPTFGYGIVTAIEPKQVTVLFPDAARMLGSR